MTTPADHDGRNAPPTGARGLFLRHRDDESHNAGSNNPTQDFLELYQLAVDFTTPANTALTGPLQIPIAEFSSNLNGLTAFNAFPQPGGQKLDPLREPVMNRWGGWYVTGPLAAATIANSAAPEGTTGKSPTLGPLGKSFDPSAYLAPGSDAVALLVLGHQTQMHNLITLTNYKTRIALHALQGAGDGKDLASLPEETRRQIQRPAEQLLRYLVFANETDLQNADAKGVIVK